MNIIERLSTVKTPCYVTGETELVKNLEILRELERNTGCKILLAQKAFSQFSLYGLIAEYISGTTASGLYEAKLGYEEMGLKFNKETHVFSPAYDENEFPLLMEMCGHIVFNSFTQWEKFKKHFINNTNTSAGLRINPEYSTQEHAIYDPCSPYSRLGITYENFIKNTDMLDGIEGFHFHTLCEQDSSALEVTLNAFFDNFEKYMTHIKWLNLGGGHHITKKGYDLERLYKIIKNIKEKYGVEVYLEPGEAVALNAGWLVASVMEIIENGMKIAILDASAACHMPDVLEMPYRPMVLNSDEAGRKKHTYRFAGNTCLAGDIIGDYSFDNELKAGDKVIFCDMAIYSMVKNNTFNGMKLPSIGVLKTNGEIEITGEFGYKDFKKRLS